MTDLASSLALGPALEPWEGFLGWGKERFKSGETEQLGVSLAALGSGDRGEEDTGQ